MSARVHLHVHASDLGKSRDFYARFFGAAPVKEKAGYVKFLPGWAPVNLALSTGRATGGGVVDHVGVQLDSPSGVVEHLARVKASGLAVREEMGVDCCHANQDKFWVQDPDGVEWEVYHLNFDLEEDTRAAGAATLPVVTDASCCAPSCCSTSS